MNKVTTYLKEILSNKDIRKRIIFTISMIVLYRLLSAIPLPGIDMSVYQQQFSGASTSEASLLLNLFTGGQLETPSIVGLGIGVYITSSIIMQLMSTVIPKLEELSKEGARGRQIIDQYTRYLTVPLAILYSLGFLLLVSQQTTNADGTQSLRLIPLMPDGSVSPLRVAFMVIVLTGGAMFVMWLAELLTEKGIGNGSSIILTVGILGALPAYLNNDFSALTPGNAIQSLLSGDLNALGDPALLSIIFIVVGAILVIMGVVFVTESTRKIPVQYARRERTGAVQQSFLPLKLNQSGVLPIIFASSLLTTPQLIIPVLQGIVDVNSPIGQSLQSLMSSPIFDQNRQSTNEYMFIYMTLIVIFAIFYAFIALRPDNVAENLQKSGGFIPGIRPGKTTEEYVVKVMLRLSFVGALFLAFIALVPVLAGRILTYVTSGNQFVIFSAVGGTSVLIVVGVCIETLRQIEALRATQNYERYI